MQPNRLIAVTLDDSLRTGPTDEALHERQVAIHDLLEENHFEVVNVSEGPYRLRLSSENGRLMFDITNEAQNRVMLIGLGMMSFRPLVQQYFQICESYSEATRNASPSQIETIDMARRGLHNEGSHLLEERLKGKLHFDFLTARRLFTLVCVLYWRG